MVRDEHFLISPQIEPPRHTLCVWISIRMTKGLHGFEASRGHGEIGDERTTTSQRTNMIQELVQSDGLTERR